MGVGIALLLHILVSGGHLPSLKLHLTKWLSTGVPDGAWIATTADRRKLLEMSDLYRCRPVCLTGRSLDSGRRNNRLGPFTAADAWDCSGRKVNGNSVAISAGLAWSRQEVEGIVVERQKIGSDGRT